MYIFTIHIFLQQKGGKLLKKLFKIIPVIALILCFSFLISSVPSNAASIKFTKKKISVSGKKVTCTWKTNKKYADAYVRAYKIDKKGNFIYDNPKPKEYFINSNKTNGSKKFSLKKGKYKVIISIATYKKKGVVTMNALTHSKIVNIK